VSAEIHNRLAPELLRRLVLEGGSEAECMAILESLTVGVLRFFRDDPHEAAEYLDAMTIAVIERLKAR
jgi:hypothetical protein